MSTGELSAKNSAQLQSVAIRSTPSPVAFSDAKKGDSEYSTRPYDSRLLSSESDGWWTLEIIGVVGSAVAIAGITCFLLQYDQQKLPDWSLHTNGRIPPAIEKFCHLSFSAALSALATVTKILLLIPIAKGLAQLKWVWIAERSRALTDLTDFQAASDGDLLPNAKLIFRLKLRHFAVIGALAMILAHAFEFTIQSLVATPLWSMPDPTLYHPLPPDNELQVLTTVPGSIPKPFQVARVANATNYTKFDYNGYYQVDAKMKSNIWAALYASDPYSDWSIPPYYCSSGTCSWDNYRSLGVCSRCTDVTSMLNRNCTASPRTDPPGVTGCDVSLPNGFNLGGVEKSRHNVMAVNTTLPALVYRNYSSPIAIIQSILAKDTIFINSSTTVTASECALVPCVLDYDNSSVYQSSLLRESGDNGIFFVEYVKQIWDNFTASNSLIGLGRNGTYIDMPVNVTRNDPTRYFIDQNTYSALKFYIEALLNGFVSTNVTNSTDYYLNYRSDGVARKVQADTPGAMQAIYQPFNCTDISGNPISDRVMCSVLYLAQGMTIDIRDNSFSPTSSSVIGQTMVNQVYVDVAWLWMAFLVFFWLAGLTMLIGTAVQTRRAGVRKWRGNPLALLFLSIGKVDLVDVQDFGWTDKGLQKKADALTVQLRFIDGEAQLVRC